MGADATKPFLDKVRALAGGNRSSEVSPYDDYDDGGDRVVCDYGALSVHRTEWYTRMCTVGMLCGAAVSVWFFYNIDDLAGDGARRSFAVSVIIRQSLSQLSLCG